MEVVRAKDARPTQVYRRLLDVYRALGRVPICVLRARHQLSFQCLFGRVRCQCRWSHSLAHWGVDSRARSDSLFSPRRCGHRLTPKTAQSSKACHQRGVFSRLSLSHTVNAHIQGICRLCVGFHRAPLFCIQLPRMSPRYIIWITKIYYKARIRCPCDEKSVIEGERAKE